MWYRASKADLSLAGEAYTAQMQRKGVGGGELWSQGQLTGLWLEGRILGAWWMGSRVVIQGWIRWVVVEVRITGWVLGDRKGF